MACSQLWDWRELVCAHAWETGAATGIGDCDRKAFQVGSEADFPFGGGCYQAEDASRGNCNDAHRALLFDLNPCRNANLKIRCRELEAATDDFHTNKGENRQRGHSFDDGMTDDSETALQVGLTGCEMHMGILS